MSDDLSTIVQDLGDDLAFAACQALAVLLDLKIPPERRSERLQVDPLNLRALIDQSDPAEQALYSELGADDASRADLAQAARTMLLLANASGFHVEVRDACRQASVHTRDLSIADPQLIIAGLAVILAWVPVDHQKTVETLQLTAPDGTKLETQRTSTRTRRAGPAAADKILNWWTSLSTRDHEAQ